jgi:rhodanese-related sulfurtransferase
MAEREQRANMTPADLIAAIDAGRAPRILDVRSRREFVHGHVPGAIHIPYWAVPGRVAEIPGDPDAPIVVYCGHGPRAWMTGAVLRARGFTRVSYLAGHMAAWRRARLREDVAANG